MPITAATEPGQVPDLFILSYDTAESAGKARPGGTLAQPDFLRQLATGVAHVPEIAGAVVRLLPVAEGVVFSLNVGDDVLVMAGCAQLTPQPGGVWTTLAYLAHEMQVAHLAAVPGQATPTSWLREPLAPTQGPWVAVLPLMGLAYYSTHTAEIVALVKQLGVFFAASLTFTGRAGEPAS